MKSKVFNPTPVTSIGRTFSPMGEEEEQESPSLIADAVLGVPRGVEDFTHSVYNLADYFSYDTLPDWDEQRLLGHSKTWAGELTNGITQFATGFIPGLGVAGKVSKLGRLANVSKVAPTVAKYSKFAAAGAASDFIAFEGNEERLSNLVQSHPFFENAITEYLAADESDGEIEGRFKNVAEGLLLEAGIGSAFKAASYAKELVFGLKNIKKQRKMVKIGETEKDTYTKLLGEYRKDIQNKFDFDDSAPFSKGDEIEIEAFNQDFEAVADTAFRGGDDATDAASVVRAFTSSSVSQESRYTPLLRRLLDVHGKELSAVDFKFTDSIPDHSAGYYDIHENSITLPRKNKAISNSRVLTHEVIHAITAKKLSKALGGIEKLKGEEYYNALKDFANKKVEPETEGIQSLVANYLGMIESNRAYNILTKAEYKNIKDFPSFKEVEDKLRAQGTGRTAVFRGRGLLNAANDDVVHTLDPASAANLFTVHEFVAEAMTNTAFARELNATAAIDQNSLWKQFKNATKTLVKGTDEGTQSVLDDVMQFTNDLRRVDLKDIPDPLTGKKMNAERAIDESENVADAAAEVSKMHSRSRYSATPRGETTGEILEDAALERAKLLKEINGLAKFMKLGDGKITGGTQAIHSACKNLKSTNGAWALMKAMSTHLDEVGTKTKPVTAKELNTATEEYADILGGDAAAMSRHVEKMKNNQGAMEQFRSDQAAAKEIIGSFARMAVDKAKEIDAHAKQTANIAKKDKQVLEAELMSLLDQMVEAQRVWSLMGKDAGLNLVQRKLLGGRFGFNVKKKIGIDTANQSSEDVYKYRNQRMTGVIGQMKMDKLVRLLVMSDNQQHVADALRRAGQKDEAFDELVKSVAATNRKVKGNKMMEMTMEYWINSLLSGPTTQAINVMGNVINITMRQLELVGGGVIGGITQGNWKVARAAFQYAFDMEMIRESLRYAGKAFKNDDSMLMEGSRVFDDDQFRTYAIHSDRLDGVGQAVNMVGHFVRLPTRGLLTGDEFFKQLSYRSNAKTELALEAMNKGLTDGHDIAKYIDSKFNDLITEGGHAYSEAAITREAFEQARAQGLTFGTAQADFVKQYKKDHIFDENAGILAERSMAQAKENTFTTRSNEGVVNKVGSVVGYGLQQLPLMRFVVPFLNTPTNILRAGIERSPLGLVQPMVDTKALITDKVRKGVHSSDPMEAARARGKIATSVGVGAMMLHYMNNNPDTITGGGPANLEQNKALQLTGWRPYSIKVGDKWWSYKRLDPVATSIGLIADIKDAQTYDELESDELGRMFSLFCTSLSNNILSKSYLDGLDKAMKAIFDAENRGERFIGGMVGGLVPNIVNQSMNFNESRQLYETRNIFDHMLKRIPSGAEGSNMPMKRNFLGEPIKMEQHGGVRGLIDPFFFSSESKDPVDHELALLAHGFTKPSHKFMGSGLSLKNVEQDGRQAYDRLQELVSTRKIGGKTLRERLRTLVTSDTYKKLPEYSMKHELGRKTPRINAVSQLIGAYRATALRDLVEEYPELKQAQKEIFKGRYDYLKQP